MLQNQFAGDFYRFAVAAPVAVFVAVSATCSYPILLRLRRSMMALTFAVCGCRYFIVVVRLSCPITSLTRPGSRVSAMATVPNVCRAQ